MFYTSLNINSSLIYVLFFRNKDIYNTYLDFFMNFQKVTTPFGL